jgi:hypothetical protein
MIRFAWTRFRTQALVGAGVLAIAGAVLLLTGIQLNHAYYAAVAVCEQQGNCAHMFTYTFPSQGYLNAASTLGAAGLAVPGLIGMFWGAPLAAREFETGTFRLAWTQGVTRTRWLAAKLAIAGVAAIAVGELFSLMVAWWSNPIHKADPGYTEFTSGSFHTGIAPAGYAAFAFVLGVTAGLLIRHTLPAMAVTSGCGPTSSRPPRPPRRSAWHRSPICPEWAPSTGICRWRRGRRRARPAPGSSPPASSPPRTAAPPPASQPARAPTRRQRLRPRRATTTSIACTSGRR